MALVGLLLVLGCRTKHGPASRRAGENPPAVSKLAPADEENLPLTPPQVASDFLKQHQRIVLLVDLTDPQAQHRQAAMDALWAIMLQMDGLRGEYDVVYFRQGPPGGNPSSVRPAGKTPPTAWLDGWGADRTALAAVRQAHRQLIGAASPAARAIVVLTPTGWKSDPALLIYLDAPDTPAIPVFPCPLMPQQCSQEALLHLGKIARRTGGLVLSPRSFLPSGGNGR
jgi:hypothetical protein